MWMYETRYACVVKLDLNQFIYLTKVCAESLFSYSRSGHLCDILSENILEQRPYWFVQMASHEVFYLWNIFLKTYCPQCVGMPFLKHQKRTAELVEFSVFVLLHIYSIILFSLHFFNLN